MARHLVDVRATFNYNPFSDRELRPLTGLHPRVQEALRTRTSRFTEKFDRLAEHIASLDGPVYIGCTGGRHRSVFLAEELAKRFGVPVEHLELERA